MDSQIVVKQMDLTDSNIREFRMFTSRVTGAGLAVPENNILFFGYRQSHGGIVNVLVCVGTVRPALRSSHSPPPDSLTSNRWELEANDGFSLVSNRWAEEAESLTSLESSTERPNSACDSAGSDDMYSREQFFTDDCHIVEYLFTDKLYRGEGFGARVLQAMEHRCHVLNREAPFRLWAASKARGFFRRYGYCLLSDQPSESQHMVHIFRTLYPMEKLEYTVPTKRKPKKTRRPKKATNRPSYGPG